MWGDTSSPEAHHMNNTVWEQHFEEPIFQLIRKIQDDVFNTLIPLEVRTINCFKGPMVVYTECYDPYRHTILINVEGNYPYQAAYQYSHEYSHIKMQFWKTYGYAMIHNEMRNNHWILKIQKSGGKKTFCFFKKIFLLKIQPSQMKKEREPID